MFGGTPQDVNYFLLYHKNDIKYVKIVCKYLKFKRSYWRVSEDAGALGTRSEASASVQRGGEAVLVVGRGAGGTGVCVVPAGGLQLAPGAMALSLRREGRPPSEEDQRVTREHLGKGPGGRKDVHPQELPLRGRRSQTDYSSIASASIAPCARGRAAAGPQCCRWRPHLLAIV